MDKKQISGFSKLSKRDKIAWLAQNFLYTNPIDLAKEFAGYWHDNVEQQKVFDGFSENTISNFHMPFGVAPNFLIDGDVYAVPMVTEESSVVAACAKAAKFWWNKGGFTTEVVDVRKLGHVHFVFGGDPFILKSTFPMLRDALRDGVAHLTANMEKRGGGILAIDLEDMQHLEPGYFQLKGTFDTRDSMGANFINSILEEWSAILVRTISEHEAFADTDRSVQVVMSILSNYTPECRVRSEVSCPVKELGAFNDGRMSASTFAEKFRRAVRIAEGDPFRATTHNKGIMNGIDAVVIATGNDFRAVEACAHTYAARDGQYTSLTHCTVQDGVFRFWIEVPLALGTVGGLTKLHPLARKSLDLLGEPTADELMRIVATVGLAQNFGAVQALVTSGIQAGHMKMHLTNILRSLQATEDEVEQALAYFKDRVVSFSAVRDFIEGLRGTVA